MHDVTAAAEDSGRSAGLRESPLEWGFRKHCRTYKVPVIMRTLDVDILCRAASETSIATAYRLAETLAAHGSTEALDMDAAMQVGCFMFVCCLICHSVLAKSLRTGMRLSAAVRVWAVLIVSAQPLPVPWHLEMTSAGQVG